MSGATRVSRKRKTPATAVGDELKDVLAKPPSIAPSAATAIEGDGDDEAVRAENKRAKKILDLAASSIDDAPRGQGELVVPLCEMFASGFVMPDMQLKLANHFWSGDGVLRNNTTAFKWLMKAVKNKFPPAMLELAHLYRHGSRGLKANRVESLLWLMLSADGGNENAKIFIRDLAYTHKKEVVRILENPEGSIFTQCKSVLSGYFLQHRQSLSGLAKLRIGDLHLHGRLLTKSVDTSLEYYFQARAAGELGATEAPEIMEPRTVEIARVVENDFVLHRHEEF